MDPNQTPLHRLSVAAQRQKFKFKIDYEEPRAPQSPWRAVIRIKAEQYGVGEGTSAKMAAHAAAEQALLKLGITAPPFRELERLEARLAYFRAPLRIETIKHPANADDPWGIELIVGHEVIGRGSNKDKDTAIAQAALAGHRWLNQQKTMSRVLRDLEVERGARNEERSLRLLQTHEGRLPEWVLSARKGVHNEDLAGVDIVVTTDRGEIPLQIKSSLTGREKFLRHARYSTKIYVLVVNDEKEDKTLFWELRKALQNAYHSISPSSPSPSSM